MTPLPIGPGSPHPRQLRTAYAYDTLNRLTTLTNSLTGQFGFSYDNLSRRTALNRPNGVNTTYGYDSLSRLLNVLHKAGTATLDGAGYTYDNAGNRTAKTNYLNNITEQYTYDPTYQLTQVTQGTTTTESYSYDAVGNRLSSLGMSSYAYNSSNELTSTPSATFTYDGNGNTLTKTDSRGSTTYNWDFENRLASVVLPGTGGTVTFKYDPFGRRIQKSSSSATTNYLYDGSNSVAEAEQTGAFLTHYAQGTRIDEFLAELRNSTIGFYQQDGLSSVTALSGASGSLLNSYMYDAFGNIAVSTGSVANPYLYTGRDEDSETELRYYRARYFDPAIGRFLSEDPIGFSGGVNFYEYVFNNPIKSTDPSGLDGGDGPSRVTYPANQPDMIDELNRRPMSNLDTLCGSNVGGACTTFQAALVFCTCDGCGGVWKAHPQLRLYGTIYYFNGTFPYKGRRPKDTSVRDATTAIAHEYGEHINPAIGSVMPLFNNLKSQIFGSHEECTQECDKISTIVNKLFMKTLKATQQRENDK